MTKTTDIKIAEISSDRRKYNYRTPIKFGGRVVQDVTVQRVTVTVQNRAGKKPTVGVGEMTMGTAWAWPSRKLTPEQALRIVLALIDRLVAKAGQLDLIGHPIDLALAIQADAKAIAKDLAESMKLPEPIPDLAILLACSAVDAALHDAFGRMYQKSSYAMLGEEFIEGDLSKWLGEAFVGQHLSQYILTSPKPTLALYHLVGALDPLSMGELSKSNRAADGLPETLEEWIKVEGLTHLKIKLSGSDLDWDVGRVVEVERIATAAAHAREWSYSLDFNECCPDEDYVIDFIERIERLSKAILPKVQYIEQPTGRDLKARKDITMHRVGRLKPVVIDESLVDLESLKMARQLGYSGVALKTCKGHSEALLMAAAAQHFNMFVCVQDLTCIGASFLHSAGFAAHLPKVNWVEGNGRQYCPAGNAEWEEIYRPMFRIRGGVVPTELLESNGLGFRWPNASLPKELAKLTTN